MNLLISDIREKEATEPKAPSFPQITSTTSGFPEHKKRTRISAFKQKRQAQEAQQQQQGAKPRGASATSSTATNDGAQQSPNPPPRPAPRPEDESFGEDERRRIDRENNEKIASMSPEDIEAARQELFGALDPSTLQMLLKRANLDESTGPSPFDLPEQIPHTDDSSRQRPEDAPEIRVEDTSAARPESDSRTKYKATVEDETEEGQQPSEPPAGTEGGSAKKQVRFASAHAEPADKHTGPTLQSPGDDDSAPPVPPAEHILHPTEPSVTRPHWPRPPQPETDPGSGDDGSGRIDPEDPDFLEKLHQKYFPSLPADPSKLAWMAPVPTPGSAADLDSPYHPDQDSLSAAAVRFDFRGALIPPRVARALPVTRGLHHHGEAPEAAGYTIPELARLARSAVPGQRCVAYQTLGRLLYRLGAGQFGRPGDPLADGLWALCAEGAVLRSLHDEAALEEGRGHRSARAFAIEAVWLFEKGGWKERLRRGK